jgi:DNA-binding HxlR family transcriptional regulator
VSTIADRLDEVTRKRLLARLRELEDLDRLVRERGQQQLPEPPRPLADIAAQEETAS